MTLSGFVLRNAFRNKRRAALSTLSVAASLFLLVTLQTFQREFTLPPEDIGASLRIAVRNKVSLGLPLPARQRPIIEKIPGIAGLTPFTYFGGKFRDEAFTPFAQFAVDPVAFTNVFVDAKTPADQLADWLKDRNSCIVGKDTLTRYGLKIGEKLRLTGTFYPVDLDLRIAGLYAGTPDDRSVFFHHKLLDELLDGGQTVGTWWVRAASAEVAPQVISTLNATFANTSAEVRAETESAFQMGFVSMWGNIKLLIGSISSVVVFTLLLVAVSTMSMAIRERFRELAILKALGYRRREIFGFILAESFGLAMAGAILGAGGAFLLYSSIDLSKITGGVLRQFEVTDRILAMSFTVAAVLGVIAALPPALAVARTSVVDGLKTLD
jgi:putative ABC transport system permease protein